MSALTLLVKYNKLGCHHEITRLCRFGSKILPQKLPTRSGGSIRTEHPVCGRPTKVRAIIACGRRCVVWSAVIVLALTGSELERKGPGVHMITLRATYPSVSKSKWNRRCEVLIYQGPKMARGVYRDPGSC